MITFTGTHVTREFGAPSVYDLAVQLMRLCRFGGGCQLWWPVGMHSLVVADLLPEELEHHGLLHDAAESAVGDVCRPFKTDAARKLERAVMERIYVHLGVPLPTQGEEELIHRADMQAVNAEGATECSPRGYVYVQPNYQVDEAALLATKRYLETYSPIDAITPDGRWPKLFERRLQSAITRVHYSPVYVRAVHGNGLGRRLDGRCIRHLGEETRLGAHLLALPAEFLVDAVEFQWRED